MSGRRSTRPAEGDLHIGCRTVAREGFNRDKHRACVTMARHAALAGRCLLSALAQHADLDSPTKRATPERPGVWSARCRLRVSNAPFSAAALRTCNCRPDFPTRGFESLDAARQRGRGLVA